MALTLRLIGGLTTEEIARAFLVPEPTIAQRIVRAKRTLAEKRVPFEVPRGAELAERLASVLAVIYLIFNEGYSATAGDDWMRPQLCEEALRLGRILAELAPAEPEVHGLVALMEIQASRFAARRRTRRRADAAARSEPRALGPAADPPRARRARAGAGADARRPARMSLQAAIAACHARARTAEETDWARIVGLYGELAQLMPSPIVELNRAVALAMPFGPAAGLRIVDALTAEPRAQGLSPAAERARRSPGQARPRGRGARRIRARGGDDAERARAGAAAAARRGLRALRHPAQFVNPIAFTEAALARDLFGVS